MRKKSLFFAFIITLVLTCFALWKFIGIPYVRKANESEALTNLASLISALEAYHREYGSYSSDYRALGYSPEGKLRSKIYMTMDGAPQNLKLRLSPDEMPLISKDNYRIIAVFDETSKIFIKEKNKPLRTVDYSLSK